MQKSSLCRSRPFGQNRQNGQSLDEYKQNKILPHISEEYEFRITNRLLIEKIIKPRRDKTIIDSLVHTSYNQIYNKKKVYSRNFSAINNRRKLIRTPIFKNHTNQPFQKTAPQSQIILGSGKPQSFSKQLQKELQGMKEKSAQHYKQSRLEQHKRTESQPIQQKGILDNSRDQLAGKIIRNHSNMALQVFYERKQERERRFTPNSNRPIIKNNYIKQHQNQWQMPKQKMKRLIKRIYQPNKDKQNHESSINQY